MYIVSGIGTVSVFLQIMSNMVIFFRKNISHGVICPYNAASLGTILPHTCSGIGGSSGAGILLTSNAVDNKPCLLGLRKIVYLIEF